MSPAWQRRHNSGGDAARGYTYPLEERRDRRFVRDVGADGLAPVAAELRAQGLELVDAARRDDDVRAGAGEVGRDGGTDGTRGPRDDRHLGRQRHRF